MTSFLDQYDSLDVIGNGSFGIIRKVRRKSDGQIFARKELNFERMSEHDRKQIVAEVNILKDLHHDHIVRYHDRYVDRDAGILYILMEYCGGGDLSTIIKQALRHNRPLPEDAIWNYFMQILLALHHCHNPNAHGRSGSGGGSGGVVSDGKEKRAQILHRDLKPDNVFLDESNTVKLGDFGLSKALAQTCFANTYVGTPYYMSPELMQERAYDSKSDIWALGCLIYELCALKPPFHEAKTHAELSVFIRNGRIPPLPRGYSQALTGVVKGMLSLNPAMRPSAAQLLQHERLELIFKVSETEKMLSTVKNHKASVAAKEREVLAREASLHEKETQMTALLSHKDAEISSLQAFVSQLQQQVQSHSQQDKTVMEQCIRDAISKREEELRVAVMRREEEVATAIARREEEVMDAVRAREEEILQAWKTREGQIRDEVVKAVEERVVWVESRAKELQLEEKALMEIKKELECRVKSIEESIGRRRHRRDKPPLEDVQNLLARMSDLAHHDEIEPPTPKSHAFQAILATPINRKVPEPPDGNMPSAMKGIILTSTGEPLATPAPEGLAKLFVHSPKVGLNFATIFDFDNEHDAENPPTSPTDRERPKHVNVEGSEVTPQQAVPTLQSQLRRQSLQRQRPPSVKPLIASSASSSSNSVSGSDQSAPSSSLPNRNVTQPKPPIAAPVRSTTQPLPSSRPAAEYNFDDENLPSPFLKRVDKGEIGLPRTELAKKPMKRPSGGSLLRAVAAANAANINSAGAGKKKGGSVSGPSVGGERPMLVSARKASEEARKALSRP